MGILIDTVSALAEPRTKSLGRDMEEWKSLANFLGIDPDTRPDARSEATYYACLKILSETVGKLPMRLMRTMPDGGIMTDYDHPVYQCLCRRPNPYQGAAEFFANIELDRLHRGNAYILKEIRRNGGLYLWRLPPGQVDVVWDETRAIDRVPDVYYRWAAPGGVRTFKSYQIMHLRSADSPDSLRGVPLISRLAGLVRGSVKAQSFQNDLIGSGLTAKAVLQYSADISDGKVTKFTAGIERYAKGDLSDDGVKNIIPIPVGTTLQPLNTKLTDAQFAELKKYSAAQIAAAFGIKPQQINDMTKLSYASSQAQQEAFYQDTMLYIFRAYEDEITWKLANSGLIGSDHFCQFDTETMLRSDYATTVDANKKAIESGQIMPSEARKKLNLPAHKDGNVLLCNGAMIPMSMAGRCNVSVQDPAGEGGESQ